MRDLEHAGPVILVILLLGFLGHIISEINKIKPNIIGIQQLASVLHRVRNDQ